MYSQRAEEGTESLVAWVLGDRELLTWVLNIILMTESSFQSRFYFYFLIFVFVCLVRGTLMCVDPSVPIEVRGHDSR